MAVCYSREEILRQAQAVVSEISSARGERALARTGGEARSTDQTGQVAFWLRLGGGVESVVLHMLKSHIIATESRHPGSGEICSSVAPLAVNEWLRRERSGESPASILAEYQHACEQLSSLRPSRRRLASEDLPVLLDRVPGKIRQSLIDRVLSMPLGCSVSVRKGKSAETEIRETEGCSIRCGTLPGVPSPLLHHPKVVLVDGVIDTVGQIHRILEDSASSGTAYLVVCRSASQEVVQTIAVNSARGTVRVILALSRLDDLTIGAIEDLAAYTGSITIDAQTGESVTTAFDRLTRAAGRVWVEDGHIRIDAPASDCLVGHVERLRGDAQSGDQSVVDFLEPRILGLSSRRLEVILGVSDVRSFPTMVETIDSDMRSLVASFDRGVNDRLRLPSSFPLWILRAAELSCERSVTCAGSALSGIVSGIKFARDLCTIGHAVVL